MVRHLCVCLICSQQVTEVNALPQELGAVASVDIFKKQLKMLLFRQFVELNCICMTVTTAVLFPSPDVNKHPRINENKEISTCTTGKNILPCS